ncbi:50S ribosomal protein L23 [Methylacidiphilum caldifontis]|uniref:Large ribosomal subunit protein uL23 n=1 Tax=Methylacidiphilum caldifontis TaxID=2795386 RepID=A0A4Y8P6C7_9BACT|nr:50S ribosomal protein L23 [Methylacidiphilum caldifontis]QSR89319.1 50S ribosomal protein L23 [Methylacidiphilum caldifontis]TFE65701.1 50S ribosomal protein L23 [Methylacidiphilum caldifontis]
MTDLFSILRSARITEKATMLREQNQYIFDVDPKATKIDVKKAVEKAFGKKVLKVNLFNVQPKKKWSRLGRPGKTPRTKRAIVQLAPGEKIDITV